MNKIAAGEVIERPASVIKELIENSIDAESNQIEIEVEDAGLKLIKITDNGIGFNRDDIKLAFKKHTTSKISEINDLDKLSTLGFRGEALPSIASVSRVELTSKPRSSSGSTVSAGTRVVLNAGKVETVSDTGCPEGTTIKIKDLFFNVPARKKFLKSSRTELAHITDWVMRLALAYPEIKFKMKKNGTELLNTPGTGKLPHTAAAIFGSSFAKQLLPVKHSSKEIEVRGLIGKPVLSRRDTSYQFIYVNGRFVSSRSISKTLSEAFHTKLMKNKYPTAVLNINIAPSKIDVNIHPTKLQVRFTEEKVLSKVLMDAVKGTLEDCELIPEVKLHSEIETGRQLLVQPKDQTAGQEYHEYDQHAPLEIELEPAVKTDEIDPAITGPQPDTDHADIGVTKKSVRVLNQSSLDGTGAEVIPGAEKILQSKTVADEITGDHQYIPLAQLHDSYILVQSTDGMLIIDQHALHERMMYEKFKAKYESSGLVTQELIVPVSFEFSARDYQVLMGYQATLEELGFIIEPFGKNTIRVRAIPSILGRLEDREVLFDILDDLFDAGNVKEDDLQREKFIQVMACKAAVKAGQSLTDREIVGLLSEIQTLDAPYTCAHGRPTIISVTLRELEKHFKRIV